MTRIEKLYMPVCVGIPFNTPPDERVTPVGRVPEETLKE
jgi:hypothetical protein